MKGKFKLWFHKHWVELLNQESSDHSIALGFAVGTFIAILPTLGLDLLLGILVVFLFPQLNKFSVFAAMVVWNPFTIAPMYTLSYWIGNNLFGSEPFVKYNIEIFDYIYNFSRKFLLGISVLAVVISILCYFLVLWIVRSYKRKKGLLKSSDKFHDRALTAKKHRKKK